MLHVNVPVQSAAVKVAFSVPHTSVLFDVIFGAVGGVPVPIVTLFEFTLSPQLLLHVAVYVPAPTLIVAVVAPVLHLRLPVQFVAVIVAFSVPHTSVLLDVICGAAGGVPVVIVISLEAGLTPHKVLHVAV